ncbi:hypothetical protein DS745_08020 [Anaerobacillus alkaliphilus]|uniref:Uncharacterized protein n=1 Tax=Anaerobacillus alkaliphilus TaxID=1548597 RepID=A0A4Q0VTR9_9BACI|nr:hypothetical protein [Anaerobacillus alkaliphilus]RXJ02030.1 hypothetical protein DS745_08020 [Anaerobacillus alkaliphilus]
MRKIFAIALLASFISLVGCATDEEQPQVNGNGAITFNQADFDMEMPNLAGSYVNVTPEGKTIYAYFTGIG